MTHYNNSVAENSSIMSQSPMNSMQLIIPREVRHKLKQEHKKLSMSFEY